MKQQLQELKNRLLRLTGTGILVLMFCCWASSASQAQTNIQIGTGTSTTSVGPIYSCWSYSYTQSIFTASELSAAGASSGQLITKVRWYHTTGNSNLSYYNNWTIRMGNTSQSIFPSTSSWIPASAMSVVYSNTFASLPTNSWIEFTLSTPFLYTGGNLVIAVDENAGGNYQYYCSAYWRYTNSGGATSDYRHMYYYSDTNNPNPLSPPNASSRTRNRPNIQLELTSGAACAGTPNPGNTNTSDATICQGNSATLTLANSTPGTGVSYQWQSSPNSTGPWTNFGTNSASQSVSPSVATWYHCLVTCSGGGTGTSNPVQVGMNNFLDCYCSSGATSTYDEEIFNVTFGSLNNTSTCSTLAPGPGSVQNMYSNYVGFTTVPNVSQYDVVPFSVTRSTCNGNYTNRVAIYIDYNRNGLLTDPGELVYTSPSAVGGGVSSGTIIIPGTASVGQTLMRVVHSETSGVPAPCGTFSWGETEDYLINILQAVPCTVPPAAGTASVSASSLCAGTSATLTASGFASGLGITYQWVESASASGPWTSVSGGTLPSISTGSVSSPTYYKFGVTCSGNTQYTNTVFVDVVTDQAICGTFCSSQASSTADEEIFNVTVGTLNNSSTCSSLAPGAGSIQNRYSNYTGLAAPLLQSGISHSFSVTLGYCGSYNYSNVAGIFIDFNHNGSFTDPGENVWSKSYGSVTYPSQTFTGSFMIPGTALTGLARMRVVLIEGSALNPCAGYTWGETEDYVINIFTPPCAGTPAVSSVLASPASTCPSQGTSNLNATGFTSGYSGISYQWLSSTTSGGPYSPITGATETDFGATGLTTPGTIYYVMQTTCANSGLSSLSNETSVIVVDPTVQSVSGGTRCGYGTVDLAAVAPSGLTLNWYDAATGGSNLGTGATFTTPEINNTTTYYVSASTGGVSSPLTTTFAGGNGFDGNMFDITAINTATIDSFAANFNSGSGTAEIWYRPGTYVGHTTSNAGWILAGTASYTSSGNGAPGTLINVNVNVTIPAGSTYGFFVYGTGGITYTNGSAVGAVFASDANIQFKEGHGGGYFNLTNSPRVFNGRIIYHTGCEGTRTPVVATVTPAPAISYAASSNLVCSGNPVTLTASSSNDPNYTYVWTSVPAGFNATGSSVTANPTGSGVVYQLLATDNTSGPNAGCAAFGTTTVLTTVNNITLSAGVTPSTGVCPGFDAQLNASASEGTYCTPVTSCTFPDQISNVSFATISNPSGCNGASTGGYTLFSTYNPTIVAGAPYPISVTTSGDVEGLAIWIDLNQDQVFDASEAFFNGYAGTNPATYTTNILIPTSALNGSTRMRIRCQYANNPLAAGPCANYTYGETEDYLITVTNGVTPSGSGITYSWTGNNLTATNIANPVAQALTTTSNYVVTVTSGSTGCIKTENVLVNVNPEPVVSTLPINAACEGSSMSVSASDYSANPAGTFAWSGPNGFYATTVVNGASVSVTPQGVIGVNDGMYMVVGTNSYGCQDTSYTNWILNPNPVPYVVSGSLDSVSCPG
ncbi:MAG TPA: GEVED domain-containing protein, partial [Bacteroidia bacterium]|nr:GEVED domain-containing protein [Bacteroidia bacterium]